MSLYEAEIKVASFADVIGCCHNLYLWSCDGGLHLHNTNYPRADVLVELFGLSCASAGLREELARQAKPLLYTDLAGILWLMFPMLADDQLTWVYALGPLLIDDISPLELKTALGRMGGGMSLRRSAAELARAIPVISISRVQEYAIMMQYLISGERIHIQDVRLYENTVPLGRTAGTTVSQKDTHGTYQAEQEMVRMVREGDLSLIEQINRMSMTGTTGQLAPGNTLRSMKNAVFVCLTLFSRAAIEGGLSPESSLSLADKYFLSVEQAKNISELTSVTYALQRDYVERVHAVRTRGLCRETEGACSYIARHLEDEITLSELACGAGYTEYYFSKKFKQETGLSPRDFIKDKRLEKAALLLRTTDLAVQEVASRLQFCSLSYFTDSFRKKYGVSPTKFRKE